MTLQCYRRAHTILMAIFQVNLGLHLARFIFFFHLFQICASFWNRPKLFISSLTLFNQVLFCRSIYTSIIADSSLHVRSKLSQFTLLNHQSDMLKTQKHSQSTPFSFLSFNVDPHIHQIILISYSTFVSQVLLCQYDVLHIH